MIFVRLFDALAELRAFHAPGGHVHALLADAVRDPVARRFGEKAPGQGRFGPFGDIVFPYHPMGSITSLELFGLDELILFSFYWANRSRYRKVLDLGANIGLHAIVLARCGFEVTCYEPDPVHFGLLGRNLAANGCEAVRTVQAAVSTRPGTTEFVRVLGNTTGSHLAGAKPSPYGKLERFPVRVEAFDALAGKFDLIKMDIEASEREILCATGPGDWSTTDAMVEVGSEENAAAIHAHFHRLGVNLFSQKTGWNRVETVDEMPFGYRDGSLFITSRTEVPWDSPRLP